MQSDFENAEGLDQFITFRKIIYIGKLENLKLLS